MPDVKESIIIQILNYKAVKYIIIVLLLLLVYTGFYHFYRCHNKLNSRWLWGASECLECNDTTIRIDSITKRDTVYREKVISQDRKFNSQPDKKNTSPINQSSVSGKNEFNENNGVNNGIIGGTGNSIVKEKILTEKEKIDFMDDLTLWEKEKNITKKCVGMMFIAG